MKTDNSVLDNAQTKPVENGLCAERGPCRSLAAGRGEGGCSRSYWTPIKIFKKDFNCLKDMEFI